MFKKCWSNSNFIISYKCVYVEIFNREMYGVTGDRREQEHVPGVEARAGATYVGEQGPLLALQLPSAHRLHAGGTVRLPVERRYRVVLDAPGRQTRQLGVLRRHVRRLLGRPASARTWTVDGRQDRARQLQDELLRLRQGSGMGRVEERHQVRPSARDQVRVRPREGVLGRAHILQQSVHQGCPGKRFRDLEMKCE